MDTLFTALGKVLTPYGIYGVMGNHDLQLLLSTEGGGSMEKNNVHLMEHKSYKLMKDGQHIIISGVRNPFDLKKNGDSPSTTFPCR